MAGCDQLTEQSSAIPVITGRCRFTKSQRNRSRRSRQTFLWHINLQHDVNRDKPAVLSYIDDFPSLYIINPTSLVKNNAKQLLATDICSNNAGIVAVTETWFKSHHDTSYSDISGYNCFRVDRSKRREGGVCETGRRYVQSHLKAVQIQFAESAENTEYLWIYFVVANLPVYLCCCYHPPKPNYSSAALV